MENAKPDLKDQTDVELESDIDLSEFERQVQLSEFVPNPLKSLVSKNNLQSFIVLLA